MSETPRHLLTTALCLTITLAVLGPQPAEAQDLRGLVKKKAAALPSAGSLVQDKPPITTSLTDAVTEVPSLDDFEPTALAPMTELPRSLRGGFLLIPGVWEIKAQSFCLKAGTYGPSKGTGHVHAPLKGPKAAIVRRILQNYLDHPELTQRDVQVLLWAIIARTKISDMPRSYQATAAKLLSPKDLLSLQGDALGVLGPELREKAFARLPQAVRQTLEAENRLRQLLTQSSAPFEELERVAVLTGVMPADEGGRTVRRGRWSYHPDGYFIRYLASAYSETTIQVYLPQQFSLEKDKDGRIIRVHLGQRMGSRTGGLRVASTAAVAGMIPSATRGPRLKEFDPSGSMAVPPGQGQRLAQSSRPSKASRDPNNPDALDLARRYTGRLGDASDAVGPMVSIVGGTGVERLAGPAEAWGMYIPNKMFGYILDWNFEKAREIGNALQGEDPPRPDYQVIASVKKITVPPLEPGAGLSSVRAAAANGLMEASLDLFAILRAAMTTFDRLGGARKAGDEEWVSRQGAALVEYKRQAGSAMIKGADRLDSLISVARNEGVKDVVVSEEIVRQSNQGREELRSKGLTPLQLQVARILGVNDQEIEEYKQRRLAADPRRVLGKSYMTIMSGIASSMRDYGTYLSRLPRATCWSTLSC